MKKAGVAAGLAFSLAIVCMFVSDALAQKKRQTPLAKKESVRSLESKFRELAYAFWMNRLTACDGDFYTRDSIYIHQFKNPTITTNSNSLTRADRLNGIEYLGTTTLIVDASRTYSHRSTSYQAEGWSRWANGFTMAMGGIDLTATVKRVKGKWLVIPNSISQAGNLQAVSCADAANPAAFYRRLEEQAFSAEVRKFRANAVQMGIIAHNIPPAMWKGMYEAGGLYGERLYTTVGWVYLAPNGGWATRGRNGYRSENLLSAENWEKAKSNWVEQVTKDGGYVFLPSGLDNNGHPKRGFSTEKIPQSLLDELWKYYNKGLWIKMVRIGYGGEWFLIVQDFGGRQSWAWSGLPDTAAEALNRIYEDYDKRRGATVRDIAFTPNGGYVIVAGRNDYWTENVPPEAADMLKGLRERNFEISQVTFGPEDSWIIRANGAW